ncbi:MAG: 16S rRNA (guanine(966)-N(2))-methyltransferase RsmD [Saezia sp.]
MNKRSASGFVRIIGGQWKRTKLPVADVQGLKPTPDRVRETLFNWLGQNMEGWRCLDVFAGTGVLGFEAASRGAKEVLLIEKNGIANKHLQKIQKQLNAEQVKSLCADGIRFLQESEGEKWDLIFLDPPFGLNLFEKVLSIAQNRINPSGVIYLESDRVIEPPSGLACYKQAKAGAVYYTLFTLVK